MLKNEILLYNFIRHGRVRRAVVDQFQHGLVDRRRAIRADQSRIKQGATLGNVQGDINGTGLLNLSCQLRVTGVTNDLDLVGNPVDIFLFRQVK